MDFDGWLPGLRALVVADGMSCGYLGIWLLDAGATVTHHCTQRPIEAISARTQYDLIIIDADTHPDWDRTVEMVRNSCWTLIVANEADVNLLRRVVEVRASYISKRTPQPDFVFAVHELLRGSVPDLARLAARGARLWGLSPHLTRVLSYNLWGYSDRDIADALSISLKTAQQYQDELRRKTGVKTKQAYLRRLLMLAGHPPLLPVTEATMSWIRLDNGKLLPVRPD
jgi:DNA-binding NarL/FixJ family response regulator